MRLLYRLLRLLIPARQVFVECPKCERLNLIAADQFLYRCLHCQRDV